MEIQGHGIDVVDLERFKRLLDEPNGDFLSRCFTPAEQARVADAEASHRRESLAGVFAAKEAVAKALGTGFDGRVGPESIEITFNSVGAPQVVLRAIASELAVNRGISTWLLSISHAGGIAVASVLGLRN